MLKAWGPPSSPSNSRSNSTWVPGPASSSSRLRFSERKKTDIPLASSMVPGSNSPAGRVMVPIIVWILSALGWGSSKRVHLGTCDQPPTADGRPGDARRGPGLSRQFVPRTRGEDRPICREVEARHRSLPRGQSWHACCNPSRHAVSPPANGEDVHADVDEMECVRWTVMVAHDGPGRDAPGGTPHRAPGAAAVHGNGPGGRGRGARGGHARGPLGHGPGLVRRRYVPPGRGRARHLHRALRRERGPRRALLPRGPRARGVVGRPSCRGLVGPDVRPLQARDARGVPAGRQQHAVAPVRRQRTGGLHGHPLTGTVRAGGPGAHGAPGTFHDRQCLGGWDRVRGADVGARLVAGAPPDGRSGLGLLTLAAVSGRVSLQRMREMAMRTWMKWMACAGVSLLPMRVWAEEPLAQESQEVRRTVLLAHPGLTGQVGAGVEHAVGERVALAVTVTVLANLNDLRWGDSGSGFSSKQWGLGLDPGVHFYLAGRAP